MAVPRNVRWTYYLYRATTSSGFVVPISVLYLLDRGYGLEFVALAQATFSITLVATQVPSGYLADRIGRRSTLVLGTVLRTVGLAGYLLVDFAAGYLALKVFVGSAWAFRSGTADAWLYELLAVYGEPDEFARLEGRGSTLLFTTSAAGAVIGGVLYGAGPELPFLVNAALAALGLPLLVALPTTGEGAGSATDRPDPAPDPGCDHDPDHEPNRHRLRDGLRSLRREFARPAVGWVVVYTGLLFLLFDLSRTFEQPALEAVGLPVAGLGVLYAGFKLVSAGAASTVGWLQDRLGTRRTLALAAPVLGAAYVAPLFVPAAIVPALFLYRSSRAVLRPIRNQYLNDRLGDTDRATVLSGVSMVSSLAAAAARVVGGELAAIAGPIRFLAFAGVTLALAAGTLWLAVSPARGAGDSSDRESERRIAADGGD
ncbi:Predicted arabinose efflux permease, MFS family [Halobiforma haloterrestris]|uniref:Predicted arabinose efflux permease, MFS family n=1 Tax=Natronobacterium haloterrestre TaxID=148448 RepID=A0A1I1H5K5_NATHA|nr:MFS transporter [Halobiforma haloterrestris]SFC19091.1 Predicted arabinose efflux permease, MFS family [Halobiforma haloterrestris]